MEDWAPSVLNETGGAAQGIADVTVYRIFASGVTFVGVVRLGLNAMSACAFTECKRRTVFENPRSRRPLLTHAMEKV